MSTKNNALESFLYEVLQKSLDLKVKGAMIAFVSEDGHFHGALNGEPLTLTSMLLTLNDRIHEEALKPKGESH